MKILAVGEIIFDVFNGEAEIGGAPLNFCAHCAARGAESAIVSGIGSDEFGETAIKYLENFGVKTDFVFKNEFQTGRCLVTVENGSPSYNVLCPSAYDKISLTDSDVDNIKKFGADVFAFGTLIQRDAVSRKAVSDILSACRFTEIFCDVNLRRDCYDRESCLKCLENATILKISAEEEPLLSEFGLYVSSADEKEICQNICRKFENIRLVLFTKGENGSLVYDKSKNEFHEISAVKAEVVSTVGAGDSYSAAFLCEYLKSGNIAKAAEAGARLSAFVVSHREAVPKIN